MSKDSAPAQLHDRLHNWGRVQRNTKPQGQACSLEGSYRSKQSGHWEEPPLTSEPIDKDDAAIIENAVCALPIVYHAILRYTYVDRLLPTGVARLAHKASMIEIHPHRDLPAYTDRAIRMLQEQLELPAVVRKQRARDRILWIREQLVIDKQDGAA